MVRFLIAAPLLAVASVAFAAERPRAASPDCAPTTPSTEQAEAECLALVKGVADRDGNTLRLKLRDGSFKTYESVTSGCPPAEFDRMKCYNFRLVGYYPRQHLFVVQGIADEAGQILLVSGRSGQGIELATRPHYAPTGTRFVSVDNTELGESDYDILVLSTDTDPPRVEWRYRTPKGDQYEWWNFVAWEGDRKIKLRVTVSDGQGGAKKYDTEAVRTAQGWQLRRPWMKP